LARSSSSRVFTRVGVTGYMGFFLIGDILGADLRANSETVRAEDLVERREVRLFASPGQIVFIEGRMN